MNEQITSSPKVSKVAQSDDEHTMTFPEAMEKVIKGNRVSRLEWNTTEVYLYLNRPGNLMLHSADGTVSVLMVKDGDMLGKDWFVIAMDN